MFLWLTLPDHVNTSHLFDEARAQNVVFVPGEIFFAEKPLKNTIRLNYSTMSEERIDEGIARLAIVLKKAIG